MNKYICSLFFLVIGVINFSQIYGQNNKASEVKEIYLSLVNSTDTETKIKISQIMPPYIHLNTKVIHVPSAQMESILFPVAGKPGEKIRLCVSATGKNYGLVDNAIWIEIGESDSYNIELIASDWIYPGDGFWYIKPFRVIEARIQK